MKKLVIFTLAHVLLLANAPVLAAATESVCNADSLGARYSIVVTHSNKDKKKISENTFSLWRNKNIVAHEDGGKKITEIWHKLPNNFLTMTRYFDDYQRAVNYSPVDLNEGRGEKNWSVKSQIVADSLLASMTLQETSGEGCLVKEKYVATAGQPKRSIEWYPKLKLMASYVLQKNETSIVWTLEEIIQDPKQVAANIAQRNSYNDTDYADIGDNESDPFFQKMINIGFIEHGSSGIYDVDGKEIGKGHHHH